jgi:hypothetical protein
MAKAKQLCKFQNFLKPVHHSNADGMNGDYVKAEM